MMGVADTAHLKDLDMSNTAFVRPDLTTFTGLDELGLEVRGQGVLANFHRPGRARRGPGWAAIHTSAEPCRKSRRPEHR